MHCRQARGSAFLLVSLTGAVQAGGAFLAGVNSLNRALHLPKARMSALRRKTAFVRVPRHVAEGPEADIASNGTPACRTPFSASARRSAHVRERAQMPQRFPVDLHHAAKGLVHLEDEKR